MLKSFLNELTAKLISWIDVGKQGVDLKQASKFLYHNFGVQRLAIVGGGHINGAFLADRLINEVSIMIGSGIDRLKGMTSVFDGIDYPSKACTLLMLKSVVKVNEGTV